ncbi:MAG TPA: carbohydrate kinase family protein [Candidatus Saccharimonadales bacterium]|nr:carbohydrate kinase family protein [Candidatus Saccharimonadales bacterium]
MQNTFDLITIGDSTIDTFISVHDATVECDVNRESCKICFAYGSKIPVDAIAHGLAGNAANVAVGAARLGLKSAVYTNLGDDDEGKQIKRAFEKDNVDLSYVKINEKKSSNLSVVITFQGERTIFVYHQDWFYHLPDMEGTKWVYLTSMGQSFTNSNIMDEVHHYIQKTGAKLAFGPGTYQLKADIKRFPKILDNCELLIVNMEEAKRILNIDQTEKTDPRDLLAKLQMLGPKMVVITDSEEGSYATDGNKTLKVGTFPMQVVQKTGAGDAYSAAFVAAICLGLPIEEAMVWGAINASHVIAHVGAQVGLMTKAELEKYRKTVSEMKAVSF